MTVLLALLKKELLDSLRDRRTLTMMLLFPVLVYPLLLGLSATLTATGMARLEKQTLTVAVVGKETEALLLEAGDLPRTILKSMSRQTAEAGLRSGDVAAMVSVTQTRAEGEQVAIQVGFTQKFDQSLEAAKRLRTQLKALSDARLKARLKKAQLPQTFTTPLVVEELDLDFKRDMGPLLASRVLPVLLVMMLFMSALYPAIDVTAGEKERGTLETLLIAPIRPIEWMTAKYLTVFLIATLGALLNLLSLGLTLRLGLQGQMTFSLSQGLLLAACLVPAAFMATGVCLAVASLAKSFKDAQSLLSPVSILSTLPGLLAMMPGIQLNTLTAAIPFLNVALLVKATVLGSALLVHWLVALASVLAFSVLIVLATGKAFSSESFRLGGVESWAEWARRLF